MEAIYRQVRSEVSEGRLQVSKESDVGPQYSIGFRPYIDVPSGGALQTINKVGTDALEQYFVGLGIESRAAKIWTKILQTKRTVTIDNVMMPTSRLGAFGFTPETAAKIAP